MSTPAARGFALCTAAMLILGISVPLHRILLDYPPALGQALRYATAAAVLGAVVAFSRIPRPAIHLRHWPHLATIAVSLVSFNMLLYTALRHADPAIVATVLGCAPLGMAVLAPLIRGRKLAIRLSVAATIVAAGTAVVHGSGTSDLIGLLCAFGALTADVAFSFLAANVLAEIGPVLVAAGSSAMAVPAFAMVAYATRETGRWRAPTISEGTVIVFPGLVLTALAFTWWFRGILDIGVDRAGITISCVPLAAVTVTAIHDGALPTAGEAAGIALVVTGFAIGLGQSRHGRAQFQLACPMCPGGIHRRTEPTAALS